MTYRLKAQTLKPLSFMLRIRFWPCSHGEVAEGEKQVEGKRTRM